MPARIRLLPISLDVARPTLGPYAPERELNAAFQAIVRQAATETAPHLILGDGAPDEGELDLKTVITRLEPDSDERPFASVQIHVEVQRRATRQPVYTRKVESEVRRLIQPPIPLDDARFVRTAMGRATQSCLRSLFTGVADAFAGH